MSGTNPLPAGQWANIPALDAGNLAGGSSFGSGQGPANAQPLRGSPTIRQPYLGSPPSVASVSGFGTGAGGFILNNGSDADRSQGLVAIRVGLNPSNGGSVSLYFPVAPTTGQYVAMAEWSTPLNPVVVGNNLNMTWANARPLIPGELLLLAYQWAVSQ
jgi:hypothetical protein